MLHILSDKKRRFFYEENLQKETTVLWEHDIEDGQMHGFSTNYVRVAMPYDPLLLNELSKVRLEQISASGAVLGTEVETEVYYH